ncbi:MAG: Uma2 family endonuclease [Acidobacteriota bacterium]|nr:Uma2 family endonuclease [Acidobacteriota bacterium]
MSQPAAAELASPPFELVYSDGEPLETDWHATEVALLPDLIGQAMAERGRSDFFVGANIFVYYSHEQAQEVRGEVLQDLPERAFRGPDVFWVGGVDPHRERKAWVAWEENGRLPDVIVELLSPKTAKKDRTTKRDLYARIFGTAEYYMYDPGSRVLEGLRLAGRSYRPILPDENGRLFSEQLGVLFGLRRGVVRRRTADWLRLFRPDGSLVQTAEERAQEAEERAQGAEERAGAAEAEVARLRALLEGRGEL